MLRNVDLQKASLKPRSEGRASTTRPRRKIKGSFPTPRFENITTPALGLNLSLPVYNLSSSAKRHLVVHKFDRDEAPINEVNNRMAKPGGTFLKVGTRLTKMNGSHQSDYVEKNMVIVFHR
ncbi:hypothetical protein ElyMa_002142200 [Elysia marginata]|uniref:Uncharacterized protein n=1 Tax=Elysia marginata TaxID=1093978 RepID=A0AAV4FKW4_9GAST|nr:hypothetical protein ElyMa_002142200 [Elysia marginata]